MEKFVKLFNLQMMKFLADQAHYYTEDQNDDKYTEVIDDNKTVDNSDNDLACLMK